MEPLLEFRRILVAVKDPGARALPAVNKSVQLARVLGAEVELFHAIDSPYYTDMLGMNTARGERMADEARGEYLQRLERIAARARLHAPRVSAAVECDYPLHEAVLRRGLAIGADLLVAECHAGRRFAPALLRLADRELLRSSVLPLLLVKGNRPYHHPTIVLALAPGGASAQSGRLAATAERLAAGLRGRLHAVPGGAAAVAAAARRLKADLVIAGEMVRPGIKRVLLGDRAARLLESVPCDLLILRPRTSGAEVARASRGARLVAVEPLG
ncbi:MAG: universal stress protein [Gammaproteobacteria bacterium]|nr:universal stress protein [Gammaproteobacteria bacterium]